MHFYCAILLVARNREGVCLVNHLGAEDVKPTGVKI